MFDLSGKVALVTGAGRGVGAGIAKALAAQGAKIAINDYFADRAESCAQELRNNGTEAFAAPFDATDLGAVEKAVADIEAALGPVDILVNNIGTLPHGMMPQTFVETPVEMWQKHLDNNLVTTLNCTKATVEGMMARGWGRVIAISSDAGRVGHYGSSVYGAAKAGMDGMVRTFAKEFGPKGVTANTVVLGLINTVPDDFTKGAERHFATGRIGTPEDIGAACVYLASEEASWVTGHNLVVNGGYLGA
jgi:NAD(P)-dependent dehydrogenase (short-subunit alcohol dehydrogenase family)